MPRSYKVGDEPVPGYRVKRKLGSGAFATVWEASAPGDVSVALKILNLDRKKVLKEFKALNFVKLVRHPNLVPISGIWVKDEDGQILEDSQVISTLSEVKDSPSKPNAETMMVPRVSRLRELELIISMGLCEQTLGDKLTEFQERGWQAIPVKELIGYMEDAAAAIDFLNTPRHNLGHAQPSAIQHCDIKPQNIMLLAGRAQVCDFGLARIQGGDVKLTSAAATPAYGAPELLDQQPPSPTTDQYSLAISYIELRTGALPFADPDSYMGVVKAHLQGQLVYHNLPADEQRALQRATARDPSQRWDTCTRLVRELKKALRDELSDDSSLAPSYDRDPSDTDRVSASDSGRVKGSDRITGSDGGRQRGPTSSSNPAVAVGALDSNLTATPDDRALIGTQPDSKRLGRSSRVHETEYDRQPRRSSVGKKLAMTAILLAGVAGGAFGLFKLTQKNTPEAMWKVVKDSVSFRIEKGEFGAALSSLEENPPPESAVAEGEQLRRSILKAWLDQAEAQRKTAEQSSDMAALAAAATILDEIQKKFPGHEDLAVERQLVESTRDRLAKKVEEGIKSQIAGGFEQLNRDPALAESELAKALPQLMLPGASAEWMKLRALTQLGLAQAAARRENWDALAGRIGELDATLEASKSALAPEKLALRHVLAAAASRRKKPQEPLATLQTINGLYGQQELYKRLPPDEWETKEEAAAREWALEQNQKQPNERVAAILQVIEERRNPGQKGKMLDELLAEADRQMAEGQFDAARAKLAEGRALAKPPFDHYLPRFAEREALLTLADPAATEATAGQTLGAVAALVADMQITLPAALAEAAASAALQHTALVPDADKLIARLADAAHDSTEDNAIGRVTAAQGRLFDALFGQNLAQSVSAAGAKAYFAGLYELCHRAKDSGKHSPLAKLAAMECALEGAGPDKPAELAGDLQLDKPASALGLADGWLPYAWYVRSAYLDTARGSVRDKLPAEIDPLLPALANLPVYLSGEVRSARLAGVLARAARRLRASDAAAPLSDRLTNVFGPAKNVTSALAWLQAADRLRPLEASEERADLVLATLAAGEPIDKRQSGWITEMTESGGDLGSDAWPIWYAYARSRGNEEAGWKATARQLQKLYAEVIETHPSAEDDLVDLYTRVLQPALARAEKLSDSPENNTLRADLWSAQGRLLQTARFVDWSKVLKDAKREDAMVDAFLQATRLQPNGAEHFVGLGSALLSLPAASSSTEILNRALAAAQQGVQLSKEQSPSAFSLRGNVRLLLSRLAPTAELRNKQLDEAIADCKGAYQQMQSAPQTVHDADDRQTVLVHLADAYVGRANFTFDPTYAKQKALLLEAERYARLATALSDASYPAHAYRALGNACEDLAWLAGRGDPSLLDKFDDAFTAFSEAIDKRLHLAAQAYTDRGRCNYKRVADSGQKDNGYLSQAKNDFDQAIEQSPDLAEAFYWRAKTQLWQRQFAKASADFKSAFEKAEAAEQFVNAAVYGSDYARVALYDTSISDVRERKAQARARAESLRTTKTYAHETSLRKQIAEVVGSAYKSDRQYDRALTAFGEGLPKDLSDATAADISLLLGVAECKMQSANAALWAPDQALAAAERAAQLAVDWRDNRLHANALGVVGQVLREKYKKAPADSDENKAAKLKLLDEAIKKFDAAVETDPAGKDSVVWRLELGNMLLLRIVVEPKNSPTHKTLHAHALEILDAEVMRAAGHDLRKATAQLRDELNRRAPAP